MFHSFPLLPFGENIYHVCERNCIWSGAEVRKLRRPKICCKMNISLKNRLRYSPRRALQNDIIMFYHPPDFDVPDQVIRILISRPVIGASEGCINADARRGHIQALDEL